MFTNISWTDYLAGIAISLIIYYIFIGVKYYSYDLKDFISGRKKLTVNRSIAPKIEEFQNTAQDDETVFEDDFAEVEELIIKLRHQIESGAADQQNTDELQQALSSILKKYPNVKNSPLRSSVNELIVSEIEKYGAVTLREDEVELLW